jgi:hypothetical protein
MRCAFAAEALERRDRTAGNGGDRRAARADRHAVQQNGAGATLRQAAAEFRAFQIEAFAQDEEQRFVGIIDGRCDAPAVQRK